MQSECVAKVILDGLKTLPAVTKGYGISICIHQWAYLVVRVKVNARVKPLFQTKQAAGFNQFHGDSGWSAVWAVRESEVSEDLGFQVHAHCIVRNLIHGPFADQCRCHPIFYLSLSLHEIEGGNRGHDLRGSIKRPAQSNAWFCITVDTCVQIVIVSPAAAQSCFLIMIVATVRPAELKPLYPRASE